jgi:DNA repair protein RecN (Recombination protein N)
VQHLRIAKKAEGTANRTDVTQLDRDERAEEIARMLAGAKVTDEARAAALSLLAAPAPKARAKKARVAS